MNDSKRPCWASIEVLRELRFVGNHAADVHRLALIDRFVKDETKPVQERVEALRILDLAMGEESPAKADLQELHEYLAEAS